MAKKRDVLVRIGADDSDLKRKSKESSDSFDRMASAGKKAGSVIAAGFAAATAAVVALTAKGLQLGDALAKSAEALGLNVDELAALRHAAKLSNVEYEELDKSLVKLARTTSMAAEGQQTYAKTFDALGLSAEEMLKLPLDEQMAQIADALGDVGSATERARIAQDLFGRSGTKLLPLLNQGSAAIRQQGEEARKFGLALDDVQKRTVQEAADSITRLQAATDGLSTQLAGAFAPAIEAASGAIVRLIQLVTDSLPKLQAMAERFLGIKAAADDLSDAALQATLIEQIKAMDTLNNRIAEQQYLLTHSPGPANEMIMNDLLEDQAVLQSRINDLLAERVQRARSVAEASAPSLADDDESLFGGDEEAKKAAAAELALVTAVYEERERLRVMETEQEAEWRQALFEAQQEFAQQEIDAERALVDALMIERHRYSEELKEQDAEDLKHKQRVRKQTVDNAFAGFTQMTGMLANHNKKMFDLNKVAAKAEAGLNAFRAIQQVWADATLPFYAKIAATALTAASTAANIAAINSTQFGGGTTPSAAGTATVNGAPVQGSSRPTASIVIEGRGESFTKKQVRELIEQINGEVGDGARIVFA